MRRAPAHDASRFSAFFWLNWFAPGPPQGTFRTIHRVLAWMSDFGNGDQRLLAVLGRLADIECA
jgi:hypothetical protein